MRYFWTDGTTKGDRALWVVSTFCQTCFKSVLSRKLLEKKSGQASISLLIENFPDAAEVILNQCVHHSPHLNTTDPKYTVSYDFKYLNPGPEGKDCSKRFSAVKTMIKHQRDSERFLLHPLTLKCHERKWITLDRFGFTFDFITYFILLVLLSMFVVEERGDVDFRPPNDADMPPNMTRSGEAYKQKPSDIYRIPSTTSVGHATKGARISNNWSRRSWIVGRNILHIS